ncbi:hypothetical protein BV25DRAFT_1154704 [Artomyces pyxidatus]|uniref:Uncharacterized protein n=1 Tax=Artomyces pyxidatus TaxID=48021 RepID=A0ACB8SST4_9AGAM|nr:hypothetical protein BV25DRAFT_1154704 [Artomyces pyxidatus]
MLVHREVHIVVQAMDRCFLPDLLLYMQMRTVVRIQRHKSRPGADLQHLLSATPWTGHRVAQARRQMACLPRCHPRSERVTKNGNVAGIALTRTTTKMKLLSRKSPAKERRAASQHNECLSRRLSLQRSLERGTMPKQPGSDAGMMVSPLTTFVPFSPNASSLNSYQHNMTSSMTMLYIPRRRKDGFGTLYWNAT